MNTKPENLNSITPQQSTSDGEMAIVYRSKFKTTFYDYALIFEGMSHAEAELKVDTAYMKCKSNVDARS
jgi:hypothetical protein